MPTKTQEEAIYWRSLTTVIIRKQKSITVNKDNQRVGLTDENGNRGIRLKPNSTDQSNLLICQSVESTT